MKRNYVQVAQFLAENFPELQGKITGGLYPTPPLAEFAANIISVLQMVGIAWMVMGGEKLLRMVGFKGPLPSFYWTIQDNPMPIMIGLFLLAPQVVNSFSNNGAFEIYLGQDTIFSKIETGGMPTAEQLVTALKAIGLQYNGK